MNSIEIKAHHNGKILYRVAADNVAQAIAQAVADGVCLDYADLRHANLVNANLDDARMRHACFAGANLMGANMSEAVLDGADFSGASLQNACLCYSSLVGCLFDGSSFGATDIAGARLADCVFSGLSTFSLNFRDAEQLARCVFVDISGARCSFFRPPLVLSGLTYPVVLLDEHIKIGGAVIALAEWESYLATPRACDRFEQAHLYAFLRQHEALLSTTVALRTGQRRKKQLLAS